MGISLGVAVFSTAKGDDNLERFEQRCDRQGGLTLKGYRNGHGWVGCYKGLTELENE